MDEGGLRRAGCASSQRNKDRLPQPPETGCLSCHSPPLSRKATALVDGKERAQLGKRQRKPPPLYGSASGGGGVVSWPPWRAALSTYSHPRLTSTLRLLRLPSPCLSRCHTAPLASLPVPRLSSHLSPLPPPQTRDCRDTERIRCRGTSTSRLLGLTPRRQHRDALLRCLLQNWGSTGGCLERRGGSRQVSKCLPVCWASEGKASRRRARKDWGGIRVL